MTAPDNRSTAGAGPGSSDRKAVNLALQGGGSHGAFTWGVLDLLLEDGRLGIEAISATSAGAMNAAVMAYGISIGGVAGARAKLKEFWQAVSKAGELYSPMRTLPWEPWLKLYGIQSDYSPSGEAFQSISRMFSPAQLNPFDLNPLRDLLSRIVDFDRLASCQVAPRLFLSATNVRSGKIKVFENAEISAAAVLASACLPNVFTAVEINGEHYWDGGFMGNPPIFPLIYRNGSRDVVVVHINPIRRDRLPSSAAEILDRTNEISFNSSLMREMRAIAFVTKLIDDHALDGKKYNRMLIHSIRDDAVMADLGVGSKSITEWAFLCRLRDSGRRAAADWLDANVDGVGTRSTIDIADVYL